MEIEETQQPLNTQELPPLHRDTVLFIMDYFPEARTAYMVRALQTVDDELFDALKGIRYTNPVMVLIISVFLGLFGVDRFMVKDIGLGLLKLLTCGGFGLWWIIDFFFIQERVKENNFEKFQQTLERLQVLYSASPPFDA
jgi:TM2 domain-containing membrane protein YozV